ncbi:unnamed protein product, partial [Rotaria sp. Silwood2]
AWIIEPKRFNAGICRGDCPNPLSRLFYPTNHAMLLSDKPSANEPFSLILLYKSIIDSV